MPHVIVKLWPGQSEREKARLADAMVRDVMDVLGYGEESASVVIEEVDPDGWVAQVYEPDLHAEWGQLYKKPRCDTHERG